MSTIFGTKQGKKVTMAISFDWVEEEEKNGWRFVSHGRCVDDERGEEDKDANRRDGLVLHTHVECASGNVTWEVDTHRDPHVNRNRDEDEQVKRDAGIRKKSNNSRAYYTHL